MDNDYGKRIAAFTHPSRLTMSINRHNYESFFLRYVDDELPHEERLQVEQFVKQHADLKYEFELLQQTNITGDEILCPDKSSLYKTQSGVFYGNIEKYMLSALDNELTADEQHLLTQFIASHPQTQEQFLLLKKTKLQPEAVLCKWKKELYRKQKKAPPIPVMFTRFGAAAVTVGLAAMLWMWNGDKLLRHPAMVTQKYNPSAPSDPDAQGKSVDVLRKNASQQQVATPGNLKQPRAVVVKPVNAMIVKTKRVKKPLPVHENLRAKQQPVPANATPVNTAAINHLRPKESRTAAEAPQEITGESDMSSTGAYQSTFAVNDNTQPQTAFGSPAVYINADDADGESRSVFIGGASINKSKLKGLFKKATVLFRKRNAED